MATAATRVANVAPAKAVVDVAIAMLRPVIEAAIADAEVSADRALVAVVLDSSSQEGAALAEYLFGNAGRTKVDYAAYARDKARVAQRERSDTSAVRDREAAHGGAGALPLVGGVHRRGITIGVSGAQPWFDEAFGVMVVELVHALEQQGIA